MGVPVSKSLRKGDLGDSLARTSRDFLYIYSTTKLSTLADLGLEAGPDYRMLLPRGGCVASPLL